METSYEDFPFDSLVGQQETGAAVSVISQHANAC